MQINAINILMSLPGAASAGLAGGITADVNGAATLGQTVAGQGQNGQFAGLLNGQAQTAGVQAGAVDPFALMNAGLDKLNNGKGNQELLTNTPIGDVAVSADGNIAIPALPVFIDQPLQQNANAVLSKDEVLANGNADKKMVWAEFDAANNVNTKASGKALASEAGNNQEKYSTYDAAQAKLAQAEKGKIELPEGVDTSNPVDQAEFAAAVAKIAQDKTKSTRIDLATQANVNNEKTADANSKVIPSIHASVAENAEKSAEVASKISAKVVDIKNEKLHTEAEVDLVATRLQELDAHLRSRDFSLIKSTREAFSNPSVADQINIQISQAAKDGANSVKIHLIPEELGKVDVSLETDNTGKTHIHIIAEKNETLDLLRRDASQLTKSLADAGLNTDAGNLQFSLRGQSGGNNFANDNGSNNNNNQQQVAAANNGYSRFSKINEQELMLSIGTKGLNIMV